ncbi:hypothetical protein J6590_048937 [Homalodisca vitripennis]|nr:hypothetical protein J6590_048937 [Homalodisca vitripennis]
MSSETTGSSLTAVQHGWLYKPLTNRDCCAIRKGHSDPDREKYYYCHPPCGCRTTGGVMNCTINLGHPWPSARVSVPRESKAAVEATSLSKRNLWQQYPTS